VEGEEQKIGICQAGRNQKKDYLGGCGVCEDPKGNCGVAVKRGSRNYHSDDPTNQAAGAYSIDKGRG